MASREGAARLGLFHQLVQAKHDSAHSFAIDNSIEVLLPHGHLPQTHHSLAVLRVDIEHVIPAGTSLSNRLSLQQHGKGLAADGAGAKHRVTQTARLRLAHG